MIVIKRASRQKFLPDSVHTFSLAFLRSWNKSSFQARHSNQLLAERARDEGWQKMIIKCDQYEWQLKDICFLPKSDRQWRCLNFQELPFGFIIFSVCLMISILRNPSSPLFISNKVNHRFLSYMFILSEALIKSHFTSWLNLNRMTWTEWACL